MRNHILLLALGASVVACETRGVVESRYDSEDGTHLTLQRYSQGGRFYYAFSASVPPAADSDDADACTTREVKLVALGNGTSVRVRLERAPAPPATPAACRPS